MLGARMIDPTTNEAPLTKCIGAVSEVHNPTKNETTETAYKP